MFFMEITRYVLLGQEHFLNVFFLYERNSFYFSILFLKQERRKMNSFLEDGNICLDV